MLHNVKQLFLHCSKTTATKTVRSVSRSALGSILKEFQAILTGLSVQRLIFISVVNRLKKNKKFKSLFFVIQGMHVMSPSARVTVVTPTEWQNEWQFGFQRERCEKHTKHI